MQKKVSKLHESRAEAGAELNKIQQKLNDAIGNAELRVRVDRLVTSCEEAMTKGFAKKRTTSRPSQQINQPRVNEAGLGKVNKRRYCQKR